MNIIFLFHIKPTAHKCLCEGCAKEIKKDQERFELSGWGYKQSASRYYHPICFLKEVKFMMTGKKKDKWFEGVCLGIQLMEP